MIRKYITVVFAAAALFTSGVYGQSVSEREAELERELAKSKAELAERDARLKDIEDTKISKAIWSPGRFTKLSYSIVETSDGISPVLKSSFGFSFSKGASYLFPGKPIAGMLKIGFDITWLDMSFASYKKSSGISGDGNGWTSDFNGEDEDYDDNMSSLFKFDYGSMSYNLGVIGVGPRVSIAPFATGNNMLRYLRASIYFHYQPTLSAFLLNDDGEMEGSYAYVGMLRFGGVLQYRRFGIGVEGYWGKAKFKALNFDFDDIDDTDNIFDNIFSGEKIDRKFAQTRIFVQFSF